MLLVLQCLATVVVDLVLGHHSFVALEAVLRVVVVDLLDLVDHRVLVHSQSPGIPSVLLHQRKTQWLQGY
eukprot:6362773-Prorocentrum_lima.AAC.1